MRKGKDLRLMDPVRDALKHADPDPQHCFQENVGNS
jgi:hypothetical protein